MNTKKTQKDIRFEKEAKALQKNLAKRKKQQEGRNRKWMAGRKNSDVIWRQGLYTRDRAVDG